MLLYVLNPVPTRSSQSHSHFPSFLILRSLWQCVSRRINSLPYVSLFIHVLSRCKICRLAFCSATRLKLDPFLSDSLPQTAEQQPFTDPHWLYYHGPLRRDNVLEYFAHSKFYDRRSCNEELRMQGAIDVRQEHLAGMRGVQYLAEEVPGPVPEDPIFVIRKVLRTDSEQPQVMDVYYVLQNMVYQAPTIFSVLNARLRRCAHMLNKAQKTLNRAVSYDCTGGGMEGGGAGTAGSGGGGKGGSDMYRVARRASKEGKANKRVRAAAVAASAEMYPPSSPQYGFPPYSWQPQYSEGEPLVLVDGLDPSYALPPMMPPPPLPHLLIEPSSPTASSPPSKSPQQQPQSEERPRFASRYPGPSPLAAAMTHPHPENSVAVDRAMGILVSDGSEWCRWECEIRAVGF